MVNLTVLSYCNASPYHEVRWMYKAQSGTDLFAAATWPKKNIGSETPVLDRDYSMLDRGMYNHERRI